MHLWDIWPLSVAPASLLEALDNKCRRRILRYCSTCRGSHIDANWMACLRFCWCAEYAAGRNEEDLIGDLLAAKPSPAWRKRMDDERNLEQPLLRRTSQRYPSPLFSVIIAGIETAHAPINLILQLIYFIYSLQHANCPWRVSCFNSTWNACCTHPREKP